MIEAIKSAWQKVSGAQVAIVSDSALDYIRELEAKDVAAQAVIASQREELDDKACQIIRMRKALARIKQDCKELREKNSEIYGRAKRRKF